MGTNTYEGTPRSPPLTPSWPPNVSVDRVFGKTTQNSCIMDARHKSGHPQVVQAVVMKNRVSCPFFTHGLQAAACNVSKSYTPKPSGVGQNRRPRAETQVRLRGVNDQRRGITPAASARVIAIWGVRSCRLGASTAWFWMPCDPNGAQMEPPFGTTVSKQRPNW